MGAVKDALIGAQEAVVEALSEHAPDGVRMSDGGTGHVCKCGEYAVALWGGSTESAWAWHIADVLGAEGLLVMPDA